MLWLRLWQGQRVSEETLRQEVRCKESDYENCGERGVVVVVWADVGAAVDDVVLATLT